MKIIFIILVFVFGLLSCNNSKNFSDISQEVSYSAKKSHPGKTLMENKCYVCHSLTAAHDNRLAPPMIAVKKHYINDNTTKLEFTKSLKAWVKNPNGVDAKMFGAIRRFGVMPKAEYSDEVITQIADYIYDNDIESPKWFEEHYKNQKGKRN
ncbi:MAG: c-type cytochrome [Winogradskyella sp.]|uniref:c-type cytochrome n=1 Tax=Winogradskyella sp. TaxID=1883156 RepID=UPI0018531A11|nr:c-type cytochrome [Winogradskyella sp.]MBT8243993.1 cytochrome c [Winogradskyella sp.]NNK23798.1 c-type cytochrome [Winogradskyella sp.]